MRSADGGCTARSGLASPSRKYKRLRTIKTAAACWQRVTSQHRRLYATGHGRAVPPATQQAAGVAPPPASGGGPPLSLPDHHRTTARAAGCSAMTFVGTGAAFAIQVRRRNGRVRRRCQPARPTAVRGTGLMWAKALRAFQAGKARTSPEGPWSWMRPSRVASAQVSWPACHLTKASASAVM